MSCLSTDHLMQLSFDTNYSPPRRWWDITKFDCIWQWLLSFWKYHFICIAIVRAKFIGRQWIDGMTLIELLLCLMVMELNSITKWSPFYYNILMHYFCGETQCVSIGNDVYVGRGCGCESSSISACWLPHPTKGTYLWCFNLFVRASQIM